MQKIKLTMILSLLVAHSLSAQDPISFERVIRVDTVGKSMIFIAINDWFATNYNSANDVIQMTDKDAGIIIGKGSMNYYYGRMSSYNGNIKYTIKVYVKDNRYKVILTNFRHSGLSFNLDLITDADIYATKGMYKNYHNKAWTDMKTQIEQYSNDIFKSLETKTNNINKDNNDDW